ncbi:hypothetical protein M2108_005796 [Paenibacillus sp. PastM-3]|nr:MULTISPECIES: hypothetical protein [unclassified Paenibacillus]MDF9851525.1 hypothetical protein [Paenibacillus sp. PastM-2]MDH6483420.1 hypothetical protein [Paenibacillus sp. PastH-2]MDH6510785.1 hypothetical protein [Paenibacillus sp. PastM-3]
MNNEKPTCLANVKTIFLHPLLFLLIIALAACSNSAEDKISSEPLEPARATIVAAQASGSIYLYGEAHGVAEILDKEVELWSQYYHNEGMRHLFVELSYFTAEYLNVWMQSDNDDILDEIYEDWKGSPSYNPDTKNFYKQIKSECPETIFHGTDVGHQYDSTGSRFLAYLEVNGLSGSEKHILTKGAIQQGRFFYQNEDNEYRENKMTENFIREFDKLGNESIMGIYGSAHTVLDGIAYGTDSLPCMANQLQERYGENIFSENLAD